MRINVVNNYEYQYCYEYNYEYYTQNKRTIY